MSNLDFGINFPIGISSVARLTRSLPDFSLRLGVDSENEVSVDVWLHGGRDNHVLSRLQTVMLDQIPLGGVSLRLLQGPVSPEEAVAQASLWCLERIIQVRKFLSGHQIALFRVICAQVESDRCSYPWRNLLAVK